jgi:hypothetical protein
MPNAIAGRECVGIESGIFHLVGPGSQKDPPNRLAQEPETRQPNGLFDGELIPAASACRPFYSL